MDNGGFSVKWLAHFCFSKNKRILSEHFKTKKRQYLPHSWSDKGLMGTVLYKLRSLDTTTTGFKCMISMKATKNVDWIRNCILKISQFISAKEIFFVEGTGGGRGGWWGGGTYRDIHIPPQGCEVLCWESYKFLFCLELVNYPGLLMLTHTWHTI